MNFYWARTRRGKRTIKRRTNKKKFQNALKSLKKWIRDERSAPLKRLAATIRAKFRGHFNYYGVIGNGFACRRGLLGTPMLSEYFNAARWIIYRALNDRSQKKSYDWTGFKQMWKMASRVIASDSVLDIPNPKIIERYPAQTQCYP